MKRQLNKVMALAGAAILTFSLAGCSSSANETTAATTAAAADTEAAAADTTAEAGSEEASEEAAPADLSGSITMAGSSLAVTARAEQIPSTCTITGLFLLKGPRRYSWVFAEKNALILFLF